MDSNSKSQRLPNTDVIDWLADTPQLIAVRGERPQAKENAQLAFTALLEPADPGGFSQAERYAVAAWVARAHREDKAAAVYLELLADEADEELADAVAAEAEANSATGPYGVYREPGLAGESTPGRTASHDPGVFGAHLAAALDLAQLLTFHPRDARPGAWQSLADAGWTTDDAVSLAQLVSFLSFQLRVVTGLRVLGGKEHEASGQDDARADASAPTGDADAAGSAAEAEAPTGSASLPIVSHPDLVGPTEFVAHQLGWRAWLEPIPEPELTDAQRDSLIKPERIKNPYFRLLARDPEALKARTLTDLDIFYNTEGGLGRAAREFAATVTSRSNGCVYCASVHAGRTLGESAGAKAIVTSLLDRGAQAPVADPTWEAIRAAAVALTETPSALEPGHLEALAERGLDRAAIVDVINAVAFFNWANRLMLGLGEPELPRRYR